jgi:inhibitor of KinA
MSHKEFSISALGDTAVIINFSDVISEDINKKVLRLFHYFISISLPGVKDIVPAYSSLIIHYDLFTLNQKTVSNRTSFQTFSDQVKKLVEENSETITLSSRKIKIPVCYAEKYGLDLNEISKQKKISVSEIIRLHTAKKYRIYMIGFLPGFAYLGEVDKKIAISRKAQLRMNVDAGSVGIAGMQTGIYPLNSPGGWQIIGKTPVKLFDKEKDDPVLLQPGDEIEFFSITEYEFTDY